MSEIPFGKFGFIKKHSLDWIKAHLSTVISSVAILVIGLIAISRWTKGDPQVDYLAAETAYRHWEGKKDDGFAKLQKILKNHPELHAKYDGAIAQKLLGSSENGLAKLYGKAALKRMGDFSPYYSDFSKATLLIAEQKLAEALHKAKTLKESMDNDAVFWEKKSDVARHGCILYAFNLLRIAMLEGAVGAGEGELKAWQALKENAGWTSVPKPASNTYDPEAYALIQENFQHQDISLHDYIKFRETQITSAMNR
jgi:hypothetical protein